MFGCILLLAPIEVRVTPHERVCDFGTRVELECLVSGYPHQIIYWLHNAKPLKLMSSSSSSPSSSSSSRHSVQRRETSGVQTVRERLIINSFSLEDAGVYQCVAESTLADDATTPTAKTSRGSSSSSAASTLSSSIVTVTTAVAKVTMATEKMEEGRVSVGDLVDNAQDTAHLVMGSE